MLSPFPGMNPYLEDPRTWSGFHAIFLSRIVDQVYKPLRPKYAVRFEERAYVSGEDDPGRDVIPDIRVMLRRDQSGRRAPGPTGAAVIDRPARVERIEEEEVREKYLKVIDLLDRSVVTVIELLSPSNKVRSSEGRASFMQKRREVLASPANWLEIDLLRDGQRTTILRDVAVTEYLVFLSRATTPRTEFAWPISLPDVLPVVALPLRGDDPDVPIDLQQALEETIERGSYDDDFDYDRPPPVPLYPEQQTWARRRIEEWSARQRDESDAGGT
ncbi:MAG: hypothetical protein AVDCRST_MAG64-3490 [uncultured Phycisphaerae bacterium]|uniref:DUF4058 family protein n=1 Tax=uncultured Phycisphaerae bacterium TaxID=904963 RepID=A0A6J4PSH5_9BACT|nr:MAG: hypothetical protein AVDCRST_MAG64-3490 [uncultured Phycisphaerae bacterium]